MKQTLIFLFALSFLFSASGAIREETVLPVKWKIQPAVSPDKLPSDSDWGSAENDKWPWKTSGRKTSWERADKKNIHRLWYKQSLFIPADWKGKRIVLDFERLDGDGIVLINGKQIGEILNPSAEIELSNLLYGKENELLVYLTRDYHGISRPFEKDYMNYSARGPQGRLLPVSRFPLGITAPVRLKGMPSDLFLDSARVTTSVSQKKIQFSTEVFSRNVRTAVIQARILDEKGNAALQFEKRVELKKGNNAIVLESVWSNPVLWEHEKPYLYTAELSLREGNKTSDLLSPIPFGFREFGTKGKQILLNGRPLRFRLTCQITSVNVLDLYQALGFNTVEFQPNPSGFYCDWNVMPIFDPVLLDTMDRRGILYLLPAPTVSNSRGMFLENRGLQAEYERQVKLWLKRYGNRPGLIAWIPSMNFSGSHSNIHADGMGRRDKIGSSAAVSILKSALELLKKYDPTRLAFGHSDGALGDIASSNMYLNFVPLQEREEWPIEWAERNEMPYIAVEFGQPCTINYWKGSRFLLTEYMAMYLGERAYTLENEATLHNVVTMPYKNMYTNWFSVNLNHYPAFFEFEGLFMRNTNRSWRTWGVTGWFNWDFDIAFGMPEGSKITIYAPYSKMKENVRTRPSWATPRWDYVAETFGPLLAYIAGTPVHTDKTHAFFSGETVRKNIALVWDGPGKQKLQVKWSASLGGKTIRTNTKTLELDAGAIHLEPFFFPVASELRCDGEIQMQVTDSQGKKILDSFAFQVFPKKAKGIYPQVQLFDPAGKSESWMKSLGIPVKRIQAEEKINRNLPLVMGRESLVGLKKLPFTADDVKSGLRVLFLEQKPADWELMGFTTIETMPRYVFPRNFNESLFAGMKQADFINWRGTPDLLPEKKWARSYDFYRAPKWTNTHAVASVALESPNIVGFEPLIRCEFDMKYSPLLRARYGKGVIYYSSLELSANAELDPAARMFAGRMISELIKPIQPVKKTETIGLNPIQKRILDGLQPWSGKDGLVIAGENADFQTMKARAENGTTVFFLPMNQKQLQAAGLKTEKRNVWQLNPDANRSLPQDLLRWRDRLELQTFSGENHIASCLQTQKIGKGEMIFCQIDPFQLMTRYDKTSPQGQTVWPSVEKGFSLYSALLNELGAGISDTAAKRLMTLKRGISYSNLNGWNVCGPFFFPGLNHDKLIFQKAEAEEDAIAGRAYPDTVYYLKDGRNLNWRQTVSANDSNFIDLHKDLKTDKLALAYLTRKIDSKEARNATLRLGMDFYTEVYLNGKLVFDAKKGGGCAPKPNTHRFVVSLKKGVNILTVKISSGSSGFGLYANLSNESEKSESVESESVVMNFYPEKDVSYDPYQFGYY